jgi:hypothetical protein
MENKDWDWVETKACPKCGSENIKWHLSSTKDCKDCGNVFRAEELVENKRKPKRIERFLIRRLISGDSSLKESDVNTQKKEIYLGLYGMSLVFLEPKHQICLHFLIKRYGYKCIEQRMTIVSRQ